MKPSKAERAAQVFVALGKSVCYLALFLGAQVLVMMPVFIAAGVQSAVGNWEMAEKLSDLVFDNAMVFSALSGLITLAVVLLFYLIRRKKLSEALWLRRMEGPGLLSGAALAPALYLAVTLMLMALPEAWLESYSEASAGISGGGVIGLIAVVLVAPVVEEFIFRGLIMTRLAGAMPGWLAVMVSAAIFGVCHGHPVWFAYAFVLGVVFGLMTCGWALSGRPFWRTWCSTPLGRCLAYCRRMRRWWHWPCWRWWGSSPRFWAARELPPCSGARPRPLSFRRSRGATIMTPGTSENRPRGCAPWGLLVPIGFIEKQ